MKLSGTSTFIFALALSFPALTGCEEKSQTIIYVSSVELEKETINISVGESYKLDAIVRPIHATDRSVEWTSSREDIATVDATGNVTGIAEGTSEVKVAALDGSNKSASCLVSVGTMHVSKVSISPADLTIKVNQSAKLTAVIEPSYASDKTVSWSVTPSEIVSLSQDGTVKGVKVGDATVTVTTRDGGKTASCSVTVTGSDAPEPEATYPTGKAGWTKTAVPDADGIVYWLYKGTDEFSNKPQRVSVADVDLSKYDLKFYRTSSAIASDAFKTILANNDSYVLMNAAYEQASIFIRINGTQYANIQNDQIFSTGVPNWKNDGGICVDADGSVFVCNSTFSQSADGRSEYGGALEKQREYYKIEMKNVPNIFSSGPLLVDWYNPLGLTFVPDSPEFKYKNDSEDPYIHQRARHPRTVIAINSDNHLLMIVADGRRSKYCNGFSAKEMTQFVVKYFNPRSALNMDGGGSSTLCIRGMGEKGTYVVNAPCNSSETDPNGQFNGNIDPELDKSHQRTLSTFFYIVKK